MMVPLTHHEILELAAPLLRQGHHVDLAASNRQERLLAFRPCEFSADGQGMPAYRETLRLHSFGTGTCRLTRELRLADGLQANLDCLGSQPALLLEQIRSVPAALQIRCGPGYALVRSYCLPAAAGRGASDPRPILVKVLLQTQSMRLTMRVPEVRGVAAEIMLQSLQRQQPELPDDLLAVLGWDWARLVRNHEGWMSKLRLRGSLQRRTIKAEAALDRCAMHLVRTLAEPPGRFHDRWAKQRWGVVFRRAIPSLTFVALVAAVATLPRLISMRSSRFWLLFFDVPTALIALSFCLQELPQYEIPPRPRRAPNSSWYAEPLAPGQKGIAWQ
jgi:hypothetical protein